MGYIAKPLIENAKLLEKTYNVSFDKTIEYLSKCSLDIDVLERETFLIFNIASLQGNHNVIMGKTVNLLNSISRTLSGNLVDNNKIYLIKEDKETLYGQTYKVLEEEIKIDMLKQSFNIQPISIKVKLEKATFSSW